MDENGDFAQKLSALNGDTKDAALEPPPKDHSPLALH